MLPNLPKSFGKTEMDEAAVIAAAHDGEVDIFDFKSHAELVGFGCLLGHGWIELVDDSGVGTYRATADFWQRYLGQ